MLIKEHNKNREKTKSCRTCFQQHPNPIFPGLLDSRVPSIASVNKKWSQKPEKISNRPSNDSSEKLFSNITKTLLRFYIVYRRQWPFASKNMANERWTNLSRVKLQTAFCRSSKHGTKSDNLSLVLAVSVSGENFSLGLDIYDGGRRSHRCHEIS